jgi:FkbM family methyltransferase
MIVSEAESDPPEIHDLLWGGFDGGLAYDVGSNVGQSLTHLVKHFSIVHGFEPSSESYDVMAARWYRPDSPVILHPYALSDHDGQVALGVAPEPIAMGQLVSNEHHAWGDLAEHRLVGCFTLDSVARETGDPDLVKIDTEGHEAKVLMGAADVIRRGTASWLIEFHSMELRTECLQLLAEGPYQGIRTIRHPHYHPGTPDWHRHGWIRADR